MRIRRIVVAGALALAGWAAAATPAFAAISVSSTDVDQGTASVITISGCSSTATASGIVVDVTNVMTGAKVLTKQSAPATSVNLGVLPAGDYTADVTCLGYGGAADQTGSTDFMVFPAGQQVTMTVSPSSWTVGQKLTVTITGMQPGEQGVLGLGPISGNDGLGAWTFTADANGNATVSFTWLASYDKYHDLILAMVGDQGSYALIGIGTSSGSSTVTGPVTKPTKPAKSTGTLPRTGDSDSTGIALGLGLTLAAAGALALRNKKS